jgi:hypothetical protein
MGLLDGLSSALTSAERFSREQGVLQAGVGVRVMEDIECVFRLRPNPECRRGRGFPYLDP